MPSQDKLIAEMRSTPDNVRYAELKKLCESRFGKPRQDGTSHCVFKMPWPGDPRVNLQKGKGGKAKAYQVKQVLAARDKLGEPKKGDDNG